MLIAKYEFLLLKRRMHIYELQLSLFSLRGLEEMIKSMGGGGGGMVFASIFPASRIVVKPIKCEYTSILDNILLIEDIEILFLQMKCDIEKTYFN